MVEVSSTAEGAEGVEVELSEALKELRKEKPELSEALLEKLEALKKTMEDASGLRDIILERRSMIDSLWSRVEEELRRKVQQLEQSLQCREREVADLQRSGAIE